MTDRTWHSTGVTDARACGCIGEQQIEEGTADYHERYRLVSRCAMHDREASIRMEARGTAADVVDAMNEATASPSEALLFLEEVVIELQQAQDPFRAEVGQ